MRVPVSAAHSAPLRRSGSRRSIRERGDRGMPLKELVERTLFHPGSAIEIPERLKSVPARHQIALEPGQEYMVDGHALKYLGMDGILHMFESRCGWKVSYTQYQIETAEVEKSDIQKRR